MDKGKQERTIDYHTRRITSELESMGIPVRDEFIDVPMSARWVIGKEQIQRYSEFLNIPITEEEVDTVLTNMENLLGGFNELCANMVADISEDSLLGVYHSEVNILVNRMAVAFLGGTEAWSTSTDEEVRTTNDKIKKALIVDFIDPNVYSDLKNPPPNSMEYLLRTIFPELVKVQENVGNISMIELLVMSYIIGEITEGYTNEALGRDHVGGIALGSFYPTTGKIYVDKEQIQDIASFEEIKGERKFLWFSMLLIQLSNIFPSLEQVLSRYWGVRFTERKIIRHEVAYKLSISVNRGDSNVYGKIGFIRFVGDLDEQN